MSRSVYGGAGGRAPLDARAKAMMSTVPSESSFSDRPTSRLSMRIALNPAPRIREIKASGDCLPRFVCGSCGLIHYKNPLLVLGCVPEWEGKILLCRRAIEPRHGFWTVPAGFMENGETMQQAAARECQEEARAHVEVGSLL